MGFDHAEPEAVAIPVPVDAGPNDNDVRIAEIEAAASIKREQIWTEQQMISLEADREELRGELRGMREVLDRLVPPAPDPADIPPPEPIVIQPAEPGLDEVPPPADSGKKPPRQGGGFWDGYDKS